MDPLAFRSDTAARRIRHRSPLAGGPAGFGGRSRGAGRLISCRCTLYRWHVFQDGSPYRNGQSEDGASPITHRSYETHTMTREQVAKEVLSILAEVRGLDPRLINEASDLSELGVTSLDALSIAFEIENRFQISVPDEQIPTFKTVGSVVDAVLGHFTQARP